MMMQDLYNIQEINTAHKSAALSKYKTRIFSPNTGDLLSIPVKPSQKLQKLGGKLPSPVGRVPSPNRASAMMAEIKEDDGDNNSDEVVSALSFKSYDDDDDE